MHKPAPRKPGPWRVIEICTRTASITTVAGMLTNWEAYEAITLPNWDPRSRKVQDDAMRYIEKVDAGFVPLAWPCTPWTIMQNINQRPHQIRAVKLQQEENRTLITFVERVAHRMHMRLRAYVGENTSIFVCMAGAAYRSCV